MSVMLIAAVRLFINQAIGPLLEPKPLTRIP